MGSKTLFCTCRQEMITRLLLMYNMTNVDFNKEMFVSLIKEVNNLFIGHSIEFSYINSNDEVENYIMFYHMEAPALYSTITHW